MKHQKSSSFFYHIMGKHNLARKELAAIMGLKMPQMYNYLAGFTKPKRRQLEKLARHLGENTEVFIGLCYEPNKKDHIVAKPDFPNTRAEIIKNCDTKFARLEIVNTDHVHPCELFLAGYTLQIIEDVKRLDTQGAYEVIQELFCLKSLEIFESRADMRGQMFEILGRWFVTSDQQFLFENQPAEAPSLRFFHNPEEVLYAHSLNTRYSEDDLLLADYKKLRLEQRKIVQDIIKEKLFFNAARNSLMP